MAITVLLADDHEIVRQGVRLLLEREGLNVVAEAANGPDAVATDSLWRTPPMTRARQVNSLRLRALCHLREEDDRRAVRRVLRASRRRSEVRSQGVTPPPAVPAPPSTATCRPTSRG